MKSQQINPFLPSQCIECETSTPQVNIAHMDLNVSCEKCWFCYKIPGAKVIIRSYKPTYGEYIQFFDSETFKHWRPSWKMTTSTKWRWIFFIFFYPQCCKCLNDTPEYHISFHVMPVNQPGFSLITPEIQTSIWTFPARTTSRWNHSIRGALEQAAGEA